MHAPVQHGGLIALPTERLVDKSSSRDFANDDDTRSCNYTSPRPRWAQRRRLVTEATPTSHPASLPFRRSNICYSGVEDSKSFNPTNIFARMKRPRPPLTLSLCGIFQHVTPSRQHHRSSEQRLAGLVLSREKVPLRQRSPTQGRRASTPAAAAAGTRGRALQANCGAQRQSTK